MMSLSQSGLIPETGTELPQKWHLCDQWVYQQLSPVVWCSFDWLLINSLSFNLIHSLCTDVMEFLDNFFAYISFWLKVFFFPLRSNIFCFYVYFVYLIFSICCECSFLSPNPFHSGTFPFIVILQTENAVVHIAFSHLFPCIRSFFMWVSCFPS